MPCNGTIGKTYFCPITNYIPKHHPLLLSTQILETKYPFLDQWDLIYTCMISHIGPSSYAWVKCKKVGSKVVLEEFKLCTYMYVIARRNILHTHKHTHTHTNTHTHTHKHTHTHTHLHCSFFLLTYTPRSVIRAYTYTGTCITSQAPYVYMHHTVKAYTCVGGKIYSFYNIIDMLLLNYTTTV